MTREFLTPLSTANKSNNKLKKKDGKSVAQAKITFQISSEFKKREIIAHKRHLKYQKSTKTIYRMHK
jgi:hypothetical protein